MLVAWHWIFASYPLTLGILLHLWTPDSSTITFEPALPILTNALQLTTPSIAVQPPGKWSSSSASPHAIRRARKRKQRKTKAREIEEELNILSEIGLESASVEEHARERTEEVWT